MIRALLVAAFLLTPVAAAAPVPGQQASSYFISEGIPADPHSEAKFPHEDPSDVDDVQFINALVNRLMIPQGDMEHYGVPDHWVQNPPDGRGDCEDYALTKLYFLPDYYQMVSNYKIVTVYLTVEQSGHAILAVKLPHGSVAYLDNLNDHLMTRSELMMQGYQFFDW